MIGADDTAITMPWGILTGIACAARQRTTQYASPARSSSWEVSAAPSRLSAIFWSIGIAKLVAISSSVLSATSPAM